jgi:Mrp family chromosome partitioning ATPase
VNRWQRREVGDVTEALRRAGLQENSANSWDAKREGNPAPAPISHSTEGLWRARAVVVDVPGPHVDQFRRFALQVRRKLEERRACSVLVTSAIPGEGKTVVACNLALALASMAGESRVALVDLDLRRPSVSSVMGITSDTGVDSVLRGEVSVGAARVRTDVSALDLFPVTRSIPRAHEILARPSLRSLIHELSKHYATVVCDSPPTLTVPDVALIAQHVDTCVLVARAGVSRRLPFREMLAMLPPERLIGTFLNFSSQPRHNSYYKYYQDDPEAEGRSTVEAGD